MTVIAFDGRIVAIDSQLTRGDTKSIGRKVFEITTADGRDLVIFGCGTWADVVLAVNSFQADLKLPKGDYTLVVWGFEGGLVEYAGYDAACPVGPEPFAWGSGSHAALGAMKMGASASKAAAIAAEISTTCGGPIVVFDTRTGRFKPTRRAPQST